MFHQQIQLPEKHPYYPSLWQSICGKWRVMRCPENIQFIVQRYRNEKKGGKVKASTLSGKVST